MGTEIDKLKAKAVPGVRCFCGRRLRRGSPAKQWTCPRAKCQTIRAAAYQVDHRPPSGLVKVRQVLPVPGAPGRRLIELEDGHRFEAFASAASRRAYHCPVCRGCRWCPVDEDGKTRADLCKSPACPGQQPFPLGAY